MAKRLTKLERLLRTIGERGSMTHKEIVQYLLRGTGNRYNDTTRKYYDGLLYTSRGARTRYGILPQFCVQNLDGSYSLSSYTRIPLGMPATYSYENSF